MILTRTPLRISLCGGGSDLPVFYKRHSGCVISTTIDKYVYLAMHDSFNPIEYILKYSIAERVSQAKDIKHPIFRECLTSYDTVPVEITSMADVPAGTGLGSSSSFTVGLLNLLRTYKNLECNKDILARSACEIEIEKLGEPIGKQDQYAAAFGGFNYYRFNRDGSVDVEPIRMRDEDKRTLESEFIVLYTGKTRKASDILSEQGNNVLKGSNEDNQRSMCALTDRMRKEMECGNIDFVGKALDEGWKLKKSLAKGISSEELDEYYERAIRNGATGGKLLGAGGGGFLLFHAPLKNHDSIIKALPELKHMPISFDEVGTAVIYNDKLNGKTGE